MTTGTLIKALKRLKVQTGSLACLGCGHKHNCGVHGCALICEAVTLLYGAAIICNEEGRILGLPDNGRVCGVDVVGTALIVGVNGEKFCDVPAFMRAVQHG